VRDEVRLDAARLANELPESLEQLVVARTTQALTRAPPR
jgi:hypothetical protein